MTNRASLILVVLSLCAFGTLRAQDNQQAATVHTAEWFSLGLGSGYFGPVLACGVSFAYDNNVLCLRYLKADELQFNVEGHDDEPSLALKEIDLLYGRTFTNKPLTLNISAGLGYVSAVDRGRLIQYQDFQRVEISTLGVPFDAGFRFEFGVVAIGGSWYGNINAKRSTYGAMVQVHFGMF